METTTSDGDKDDDKLEQKCVYSDDQDKPLNIRYNTIAVEHQKSGTKGTLGLRALLYIVVAYLDKSHKKQAINKFIKHWLDKNAGYKHRKKIPKSDDKSLDKRIKARCDYLISLYENKKEKPSNLQDQIRFITKRIAVAWRKKNDRALNKHEYKHLEDLVRYYRKQDLYGYLTKAGIDDLQAIELGYDDDKSLKHAIKKDRIQDVYKDMVGDYDAYLKGVREEIHKKDDEEKERIAKAIGCRLPSSSSVLPSMPVGLPERVLRQEYFSEEKTTPKLVDLIKKLSENFFPDAPNGNTKDMAKKRKQFFPDVPNEKTKDATKQRDQWCRKQLLLCMAWDIVVNLSDQPIVPGSGDEFPKLVDIGCSLMFGDKTIIIKFGESWRNMSKLDEKFVSKLIKHYLNDAKEVQLLRSDRNKSDQSIKSALNEMRDERYLFMQAILQWECDLLKENRNNDEPYVSFLDICKKADLGEEVTEEVKDFRNNAFHDDLSDSGRFSDCPEPIKSIYEDLKKKRDERRSEKKKTAAKVSGKKIRLANDQVLGTIDSGSFSCYQDKVWFS